jgi:hypothetical protein
MPPSGYEVVARYANGEVRRGETWDFRPERAWFQLREDGSEEPVRVILEELKALFFVKSLGGDELHDEAKRFTEQGMSGSKTWVEFADGEELAGWAESLTQYPHGFYLFPADTESNNQRVFVVRSAVVRLLYDADAEHAAREYEQRTSDQSRRHAGEMWKAFLGDSPKPKTRPHSRAGSGLFLQDF